MISTKPNMDRMMKQVASNAPVLIWSWNGYRTGRRHQTFTVNEIGITAAKGGNTPEWRAAIIAAAIKAFGVRFEIAEIKGQDLWLKPGGPSEA